MDSRRSVMVYDVPYYREGGNVNDEPVPAVREWLTRFTATAPVLANSESIWASFEASDLSNSCDKKRRYDLERIAEIGSDVTVLCGDRGATALATGIAFASFAQNISSISNMKSLKKTVLVTAADRVASSGEMLKEIFPCLKFAQYTQGAASLLYEIGEDEYSVIPPQCYGLVTDTKTALWVMNNGFVGNVVLDEPSNLASPSNENLNDADLIIALALAQMESGEKRRFRTTGSMTVMGHKRDAKMWDGYRPRSIERGFTITVHEPTSIVMQQKTLVWKRLH